MKCSIVRYICFWKFYHMFSNHLSKLFSVIKIKKFFNEFLSFIVSRIFLTRVPWLNNYKTKLFFINIRMNITKFFFHNLSYTLHTSCFELRNDWVCQLALHIEKNNKDFVWRKPASNPYQNPASLSCSSIFHAKAWSPKNSSFPSRQWSSVSETICTKLSQKRRKKFRFSSLFYTLPGPRISTYTFYFRSGIRHEACIRSFTRHVLLGCSRHTYVRCTPAIVSYRFYFATFRGTEEFLTQVCF